MQEKPIISKMEEFAKETPPYEWYDNEEVPKEYRDFQQNVKTGSDDFWYCLENGYITLGLITDEKLENLSYKDLQRVAEICSEYGVEY